MDPNLRKLSLALLGASVLCTCSGHGQSGMLPSTLAHSRARPQTAGTSPSYQSIVITDGAVAYYRLNDSGTVAADSSGNGLNGAIGSSVVTGAPGLLTSSTDTAMNFPGTQSAAGEVRVTPAALLQPASAVSLEAWFRFSTVPVNFTVIAAYGRNSGLATYEMYVKNGDLIAQATLSSGLANIVSPSALAANQIYHAVETYDGTYVRLYLNGSLIATSAAKAGTLAYTAGYGFSVGDDYSSNNPAFSGTIGEVAVYPSALSATQVADHYNVGTEPPASPSAPPTPTPTPGSGSNAYQNAVLGDSPSAFYVLDDTGTTAADLGPYDLTGTVGSAITEGVPGLVTSSSESAMGFPGTQSAAGAVRVSPAAQLQPSSAVSLEAWFRFAATPANFTVLAAYGRNSGLATYELYVKNGALVSQITSSSGLLNLSSAPLTANQSYYAVATYDGTYSRLYLNGALVATSAAKAGTLSYTSGYGFSIGDDYSSNNPAFAGTIADVAVYAAALSATQVLDHYDAGLTASPSPTSSALDWDSFGYDIERTGYNPVESTVGAGNVGSLQKLWSASVGSGMVHEPVLAAGVSIGGVATNVLYAGSGYGSTMYAINANTGATIWTFAVPSTTFTCNGGVSSTTFSIGETPAIDRSKNRIYFSDGHNQVHALDLASGAEASGWPITIADYAPDQNFMHGGFTYNPANGMLYAVTGSTCDITPWYGRIVAINTNTASIAGEFFPVSGTQSQGGSGGGVWGPGGASIDPSTNNVYIATGNADTATGQAQNAGYAEQIVELTPALSSIVADNYPPNLPTVAGDDDFDFGATPLLFQPSGCPAMLAAVNKSGMFELYDRSTIGSGPVQDIQMAIPSDYGSFVGVPAFDPVTNDVYVGLPSTEGIYRPGIAAFALQSNCTLNPTPVWSANFGPDGASTSGETPRSPVSIANGVVYVAGFTADTEYAFNAATGAQLWSVALTGTGNVGTIVSNGVVYVSSGNGTITAYALPSGPASDARRRP